MITFIEKGDIFLLEGIYSYGHGCNCAGAMGKGIAVQFKERFPNMYLQYKKLCKDKLFLPGDVFDYTYENGHIYNLATQESWRTSAKPEYIEQSVKTMLDMAQQKYVNKIAIPAIGAGLGGLKWEDIKSILQNAVNLYPDVHLYVVEKYG